MPSKECAHCLGALLLKRMVASWSGPRTVQPTTRLRRNASRAMAGSPRFVLYPTLTPRIYIYVYVYIYIT